jgi:hypothetical protein
MRRRSNASLTCRHGAGRSGRCRALLLAVAGCAVVIGVAERGGPSPASGALARAPSASLRGTATGPSRADRPYRVLQMNLCLSGMAGCYGRVAYPAGLVEAFARIREARPDAVTVNEACGGDVAWIARRSGYHLRFSTVTTGAGPLRCVHPGGRGHFGDAVLTKAPIEHSDSHDFASQAGSERRRWLCATTRADVDVCTAHLATRSAVEVTGNQAQCAELAAILARRAAARTVVFAGDVNRRRPCAPDGLWARTDGSAAQAPSLQHVYGGGALGSPSARVVPATHTDHDVLLVHADRRRT